jgi:D-3-phosphoglycerate dehydrogenase / 2-oxoglutarate reductase
LKRLDTIAAAMQTQCPPKIMLVEHIHPAGEALLSATGELVFPYPQNSDGIVAAIGPCDALVVRNTKITRTILEAAPHLRVIGRHGVGYDSVDIDAARALRIPVVYTPAANTESVAEIVVAFILMLGRKINRAHEAMQHGELLSDTVTLSVMAQRHGLASFDLWGKTLGIVGVGRIGSSVARKMTGAFNMRVLGYDPYLDEGMLAGYGVVKVKNLDDMLPQCDFVSLHCPGGTETRHMIDATRLACFKPGAYLINTARGSVVDETALVAALQSGQLGGAAIDVYDPEPPDSTHPFLRMDNVIVTPHFCAMTEESLYNMGVAVAQGIRDVLADRMPQFLVNPEIWATRRSPSA